MEKQMELWLKSVQTSEGNTDVVEQRAVGRLSTHEKGWQLTYEEGTENGMGHTVTTLTVPEGRVVMTRSGETTCRMVFRVGRSTVSDYRTLYGAFPLEIWTHEAETTLIEGETGTEGRIFLRYDLSLGGGAHTETTLELRFRERGAA